ncbi:MAG: CocE/NonD family hydrolase C-terminal non-catalytic domain-containing protein, partial [Wenzhouxiangella sp.]
LEPGRRYRVRVQLNDIAYAFPEGHTIRVAISTTYWPMIWPSQQRAQLTVHTGRCSQLELPTRPPHAADEGLAPFESPERGPEPEHTPLEMVQSRRTVELDLTTDETIYTVFGDGGDFAGAALARIDDIDLTVGYTMKKEFRIAEHEPLSARASIEQKTSFERGDWDVRVECLTVLTSDADNFFLHARLEAWEGPACIFNREWNESIPRKLV